MDVPLIAAALELIDVLKDAVVVFGIVLSHPFVTGITGPLELSAKVLHQKIGYKRNGGLEGYAVDLKPFLSRWVGDILDLLHYTRLEGLSSFHTELFNVFVADEERASDYSAAVLHSFLAATPREDELMVEGVDVVPRLN